QPDRRIFIDEKQLIEHQSCHRTVQEIIKPFNRTSYQTCCQYFTCLFFIHSISPLRINSSDTLILPFQQFSQLAIFCQYLVIILFLHHLRYDENRTFSKEGFLHVGRNNWDYTEKPSQGAQDDVKRAGGTNGCLHQFSVAGRTRQIERDTGVVAQNSGCPERGPQPVFYE